MRGRANPCSIYGYFLMRQTGARDERYNVRRLPRHLGGVGGWVCGALTICRWLTIRPGDKRGRARGGGSTPSEALAHALRMAGSVALALVGDAAVFIQPWVALQGSWLLTRPGCHAERPTSRRCARCVEASIGLGATCARSRQHHSRSHPAGDRLQGSDRPRGLRSTRPSCRQTGLRYLCGSGRI
jgi:hypothetical protein